MAPSKKCIAMLVIGALLAALPAWAQIPDLEDKVEQLTAEVRAGGADLRPLYQDIGRTGPAGAQSHRLQRTHRGHGHTLLKPARGAPSPSTHARPAR